MLFPNAVCTVRGGYFDGCVVRGLRPGSRQSPLTEKQSAELAFLKSLDLRGAVAFDVGANCGSHTFLFHKLVGPDGEVHAFEPDPTQVRNLWDMVELNRIANAEIHPVAAGSTPGQSSLIVPDGSRLKLAATLSNDLGAQAVGSLRKRTHTVRVVRLDDYAATLGLRAPNFMKIDVEGFELEVLRGATKLLGATRPAIFVEIHGIDGDAKQKMMRDVLLVLEPLGYRARHVETKLDVAADRAQLPEGGHLYATAR